MSRSSAAAPAAVSIVLAVVTCLVLVLAGCSSGQHSQHARPGTGQNTRALARAYLAIAEPANHRLDVEVERYEDESHKHLAAAESALSAQAATERAFDKDLAKIAFPPAIAVTARALISVNEIRAMLAERQAQARSISALLSLAAGHKMADAQVEAQVRVIRAQLGLPPPETS